MNKIQTSRQLTKPGLWLAFCLPSELSLFSSAVMPAASLSGFPALFLLYAKLFPSWNPGFSSSLPRVLSPASLPGLHLFFRIWLNAIWAKFLLRHSANLLAVLQQKVLFQMEQSPRNLKSNSEINHHCKDLVTINTLVPSLTEMAIMCAGVRQLLSFSPR